MVCVACVALGDIDLHFAWQSWHLVTWTFTLRGRRGAYSTGRALVARLGLAGAAAVCVAGVALDVINLHFAWQAWRLATWTFTLCGRCGTYGTVLALVVPLSLAGAAAVCVAGVALGDIDLHFAWRAGSGGALGSGGRRAVWQAWHLVTATFTLRGRCGTW